MSRPEATAVCPCSSAAIGLKSEPEPRRMYKSPLKAVIVTRAVVGVDVIASGGKADSTVGVSRVADVCVGAGILGGSVEMGSAVKDDGWSLAEPHAIKNEIKNILDK